MTSSLQMILVFLMLMHTLSVPHTKTPWEFIEIRVTKSNLSAHKILYSKQRWFHSGHLCGDPIAARAHSSSRQLPVKLFKNISSEIMRLDLPASDEAPQGNADFRQLSISFSDGTKFSYFAIEDSSFKHEALESLYKLMATEEGTW
jgi:hypothetical protein